VCQLDDNAGIGSAQTGENGSVLAALTAMAGERRQVAAEALRDIAWLQ
jgi:hypothetical protein